MVVGDEGGFQLAMKALHESVGARVISCRAYVLSPEKSREGCEKSVIVDGVPEFETQCATKVLATVSAVMFDQFVYLSHVSWKKVEGRSAIKYVMARELCEENP